MTDKAPDDFLSLLEGFIDHANTQSQQYDLGVVTQALITASARFSAHYVASACESRKDLKEDKDETIHQFGGEFKRELAQAMDDYIENYKVYLREDDE